MNMKKVLQVRMREGDLLKVRKMAEESGVSMCEWARRRILGIGDVWVRIDKDPVPHVEVKKP